MSAAHTRHAGEEWRGIDGGGAELRESSSRERLLSLCPRLPGHCGVWGVLYMPGRSTFVIVSCVLLRVDVSLTMSMYYE